MILLVSLQSFSAFSQADSVLIIFMDQTRYCLTENQALLTVELYRENEIHKGKVIDLSGANESLKLKVVELKGQLMDKDTILSASDELLAIEGERVSMTKKELRKQKRMAIGQWFKDKWQMIVVASGAFGVGVGVGFFAK